MGKDRRDTRTVDLFSIPEAPPSAPGSLDMAAEVCGVLTKAIKESEHSRAVIAATMSDLTGADISVDMLNAWTAKSHDRHRFPFEYAAAFEAACETTALQELFARKRGSTVLVGKEALDAELGRNHREQAKLKEREKHLKQKMRELHK